MLDSLLINVTRHLVKDHTSHKKANPTDFISTLVKLPHLRVKRTIFRKGISNVNELFEKIHFSNTRITKPRRTTWP